MARIDRAIARTMFPDWATKGWSAARMIRGLRVAKIPLYRRTDMLRDIRQSLDRIKFSPRMMAYDTARIPTKTIMSETELGKPRKYLVTGRFKERDLETGRVTYNIKSIYTDTLKTKDGFVDDFMGIAEMGGAGTYKNVEEGEILFVAHNRGFTY